MRSALLLSLLAMSLGAGCSNAPAPVPAASTTVAPAATHLGAWYWIGTKTSTETLASADPARYRIEFVEGDTLLVQADCNRGRGGYTLAAGTLAIGPIALTKMGCAEDSQDREFLAHLASARSLKSTGDWLHLELGDGRGSMHLARDPKSVLPR